jgi:hypothetical protein
MDNLPTSPNLMLVWYLMSSYLYYECETPVLSDYEFDTLARKLIDSWEEVDHPHKRLITLDDLQAGTGYAIKYPLMVKNAAIQWRDTFKQPTKKQMELF